MTIISDTWADALDPIVEEWFELGAGNHPMGLKDFLYRVVPSVRSKEEASGIGAISPDSLDHYENNRTVPDGDFDQWFKKTFTHTVKVLGLPIEQTFIEDNLVSTITDMAFRLGDVFALREAQDAASTFNNAFSGSFLGADGVALCSDSHQFSPQKTNNTQDNNFTLALSKGNVATIREAMMAFTDDNGNIVGVNPDILFVPRGLEDEALVIAGSLLTPGSANNDLNPHLGRYQVVTGQYLTDSNAWFMLDSKKMDRSLLWYDRIPLNINFEGVKDQVVARWTARTRYSFGWTDWRWCAGSNPS